MVIQTLDQTYFLNQFIGMLPVNWFAAETTDPKGEVYCIAAALAAGDAANNTQTINFQRRVNLSTAVGSELDTLIQNFYKNKFPRMPGESDASYLTRFKNRLYAQHDTVGGMIAIIQDTLNETPVIRENGIDLSNGYWADYTQFGHIRPGGWADPAPLVVTEYGGNFAYNENTAAPWDAIVPVPPVLTGNMAWDVNGMWGTNLGPYQALIDVQQPEPIDPHFLTYRQIMSLITDIKPAGTVMWVRVIGPVASGGIPI